MTKPTSFRDVELLSSYLDNQLSQVDKTRLEERLKIEPDLRNIADDLTQSRAILGKLPLRRAPRNFTLTPKMAGVKPPLPRAFPIFRFASALATILFIFAFTANLSVPTWAALRAAVPAPVLGMGGGGGGGDNNPSGLEAAAPAAPSLDTANAPTPTPEFGIALAAPTQGAESPAATEAPLEPMPQAKLQPSEQTQPQLQPAPEMAPIALPIPAALQFGLLGLAVVSGGAAYLLRSRADSNWFKARALKPGKVSTRQIILFILALLTIIALAISIYYISTTTFYAPVASANPFSAMGGDKGQIVAGDKGLTASGEKATGLPVGAQGFTLTPGLGYNFSSLDEIGLMTAIEFPADVLNSEMIVSYIPGLAGMPPTGTYFANRAFSLVPADKNIEPLLPFSITLEYGKDIASTVDANSLALYWWNGQDWQDATGTCNPATSYERAPETNRISVSVCKMGSYVLMAP